jgi:hypothetical protein
MTRKIGASFVREVGLGGKYNILVEETFASPSDEEPSRLNSLFSLWVMQIPRPGLNY